jgi:hypothetical protein
LVPSAYQREQRSPEKATLTELDRVLEEGEGNRCSGIFFNPKNDGTAAKRFGLSAMRAIFSSLFFLKKSTAQPYKNINFLMCMVQLYILHLKDGMHIFRYLELFLLIH